MNIEDVRQYALQMQGVTENLFAKEWISFRIEGKWFMLMQLDAPEARVAVKLPPDEAQELRDRYDGIRPAYHMNKTYWSDLYLDWLEEELIKKLIKCSYDIVVSKLPKKLREIYS